MKKRKWLTMLLAATMIVMSIAGCNSGSSTNTSSTTSSTASSTDGKLTTVRINQAFQSLLYLPLYVANDAGFFKEEGLNVAMDTAGGGPQAWSAVIGGSADFSLQDPVYVPIARNKGNDDGVVFSVIQNAPTVWVLGKDKVDISKDLSGLYGKTVVTGKQPDTDWALFEYLCKEDGVKDGQITLDQTSIGSQIAPVLAGRADYALSCEPVVTQGETQGLNVVYSFADCKSLSPMAFSCLTTTKKYISAHPKEAQGVMNAIEKACRYIQENKEGTLKIAYKEFPELDQSIVKTAVERMLDAKGYPEHALVSEQAWENNMKLALVSGNIKEYPADYSSYSANVEVDMAKKAEENVK